MSFPIDYMFFGKSKDLKYRLVGNVVQSKLSFAIAKRIKETEGDLVEDTPYMKINTYRVELTNYISNFEMHDFIGTT